MAEPENIRLPTLRVVIESDDLSENEDELPDSNSSAPAESQGEPLSGLSQHIANSDGVWKAIASAPDFCWVGNSITAFDSSATLDNPVRYSPNVIAAGREVYREGDLLRGIQGDAGRHVVSGTSLGSGCVLILQGQRNVKVNGLPVARHDSPCTVNCNEAGVGGTPGYLTTAQQSVESSPGQPDGEGPSYNPGEEAGLVLLDMWEDANAAARTAWEALPITSDDAATEAARGRAWQGVKDTYEAVDVLSGPSPLDLLDSGIGWLQGDAERAGQFGEEWKRTREAYGGLWDSGVEAWQESEERNGIGGAMEMSATVFFTQIFGGKGTGMLRGATKIPDLETLPPPPSPPPSKGVHVQQPSNRMEKDRDLSEKSNQNRAASFGDSTTKNYKATFFEANPDLKGKVVVHHAVEQQVQKRYPGLVSDSEMHSLENLRGIPKEINPDIHLSKIRKEWNRFYRQNKNPTKQQLLDKATEIDDQLGSRFNPPVRD